ncbi:MAG: urease accessory protein [Acidobacteria bacterium]|nr:urease accessory protein [Acidobacteriota bacterium]
MLSEITIPQGLTLASTLVFGFLLGLRHSLEPDHLAAVSTIVNDGKSFWRATLTGCLWGVGHTLSLLIVGGLIILFKFDIGQAVERLFELLVAATLILLGASALWRLYRHARTETPENGHGHRHKSRSLLVGMIHGLAGSGTLTILISSTISPPATAFFFLLIFGIGSISGMTVASLFLTLPLRITLFRFNVFHYFLRGFAGIVSLSFGSWLLLEYFAG